MARYDIRLNNRGAMDLKGIIATLVVGSILMVVGLYVYSKVTGQIDTSGFTAEENQTLDDVKTNVTAGFSLTSIAFIVIAAAAILSIVIGSMAS